MSRKILGGVIAIVVATALVGASRAESASRAETAIEGPSADPIVLAQAGIVEPEGPSGDGEPLAPPTVVAAPTGACGANQVEVEGDYCPALEQKCLRWLDPDMKLRCAEFATDARCQAKAVHKHFCIDVYEFPNQLGAKPQVLSTWYEARDACKAEGKRLCKDSEWTLACEGQERLPYPYGYARNANACNIDKPHLDVNEGALRDPSRRQAEVDRLYAGVPSGSMESCVSPYGAHDMTGNVDEWVVNESAYPYQSGSKGGYWGPVRTRCRPMTTAHYELFSFYQLGFRCCSDAKDPKAGSTAAPAAAPTPRGTAARPTAPVTAIDPGPNAPTAI